MKINRMLTTVPVAIWRLSDKISAKLNKKKANKTADLKIDKKKDGDK